MPTYECDDFRVTFARAGEPESGATEYRVDAVFSGGRSVSSTFRLPMSSTRLEELVVNLGRSGTREIAPTDLTLLHADAEQLGSELGNALFDEVIGTSYTDAQRVAAASGKGLRLTLSLSETPELLSVPWELLYRRPRFLASQRHTPIVRFLDVGDAPQALPIDGPVRVLGVVASPSGLIPLDVEDERSRIASALDSMVGRGLVELEWCDPATPRSLRHSLRDGTFHILHFVGHSDFDASGDGTLYLLDEHGAPSPVTDTVLTALLGDQTSLRLVVLNSCKGARTTLTDPFSGIATSLVALGLPAVVAMQFSISDDAAIVFAEELFTSLVGRQYPIDAAVSEARKAVFAEVSEVEWATPVLFLRAADGQLFDFAAAPAPIPLRVAPVPLLALDDATVEPTAEPIDEPTDAPDLDALVDTTPPPPPPPPPPPRPPEPNRWRRILAVGAAAVVIVAGIGAALWMAGGPDDDEPIVDDTTERVAIDDTTNRAETRRTEPVVATAATVAPSTTPSCNGSPVPPRPALTGLSPEFDVQFETAQRWVDTLASAQPGTDNADVVATMESLFPNSPVSGANIGGFANMEASFLLPVNASVGDDGTVVLDTAALVYDNATGRSPCRTGFLCSEYTVSRTGTIDSVRWTAAPPMTLDDVYTDGTWLASTDLSPFADRQTVADWFTDACAPEPRS